MLVNFIFDFYFRPLLTRWIFVVYYFRSYPVIRISRRIIWAFVFIKFLLHENRIVTLSLLLWWYNNMPINRLSIPQILYHIANNKNTKASSVGVVFLIVKPTLYNFWLEPRTKL